MKNSKNTIWFIKLLTCLLLIMGCAQQIPVGKIELLTETSQTIYKNTIDTYARIEKLQRRFAVTTTIDSNINRNSFKPQIEGQSFDLVPELKFREAAFEVLVKYFIVLHRFSSKDYMSDIEKATQILSGSIRNLTTSANMFDNNNMSTAQGTFATLIKTISQQIVKKKKKDALKKVMAIAQSDVAQLSKLITGSNFKIKTAVGIMLNRIIAHANVARPSYTSAERFYFDLKTAAIITEVEEIELSLESMSSAMQKIPEAHKEIQNTLDKQPTTLEALQTLIEEADKANKFYRNL